MLVAEVVQNSIVSYIISITDVNLVEFDLYFERFINPFRASPPDFDIDFSWKDRDDVINYIFTRFKNTALLATYNTFKYKAVIRELGKVFGLPKVEIDKLSKTSKQQKTFLKSTETPQNKGLQQDSNNLATGLQPKINRSAKIHQQESNEEATAYQQQEIDSIAKLVLKYGKLIEGFPNYISIHTAVYIKLRTSHYYT